MKAEPDEIGFTQAIVEMLVPESGGETPPTCPGTVAERLRTLDAVFAGQKRDDFAQTCRVGEAHFGEEIRQSFRHQPRRRDETVGAPILRFEKRAASFEPLARNFQRQVEELSLAIGVESRPEKGRKLFR